jgi:flagellar L-ring protein precursor FlgH
MKNLLAACALVALFAGCAQVPTSTSAALPSLVNTETTIRPVSQAAVPLSRGSLVPASQINPPAYRSLFEDRRPSRVGDTLMIVLNETTRASKLGGTQASRGSSNALNASTSLGTSLAGVSSGSRTRDNKLGLGSGGSTQFDSKGGSSASNEFSGMITVTVIEVLSNGNLVVAGEKRLAVGAEEEIIRFSGVVMPQNVQNGSISSSMVADARIEYRGSGVTDEVQRPGWLTQLFMRYSPN